MRVILPVIMAFFCVPVLAGAQQSDGSPIVIGPGGVVRQGNSCAAPAPLIDNTPSAISNYQAARQKFMDCARGEAANGTGNARSQQDLDRSLSEIGDDQNQALDEVRQETRGAADKLGQGGARP